MTFVANIFSAKAKLTALPLKKGGTLHYSMLLSLIIDVFK